MKKKFFYSMLGSLGLIMALGLQGCGQSEEPPKTNTNPNGTISEASKSEQGLFLVIQQTAKDPDAFIIVEKHPSSTGTRAILKDMEGKERMLTEEELKKIAEAEAAKVENGTSNLTQTPAAASSPGLSLGETILAGAAGALIGGMIANKLAGNSNYQQHQQQQQAQTSSYQQTQRSLNTSSNTSSNTSTKPKQGIFSGSKTNKSSSGGLFKNFGRKKRR